MEQLIRRDDRLQPISPQIRSAFEPQVRYYIKPRVLFAVFVLVGGACGFIYGFLTV